MKKSPLNISASITASGMPQIKIDGDIAKWTNNSSKDFSAMLNDYAAKGYKHVELYINSSGGDVLEANEIINQIKAFPGDVSCLIGALAASAATDILVHCKNNRCHKNSMGMVHQPETQLKGNLKTIESRIKALTIITNQYRDAYVAGTNLTEKEVDKMWDSGDYWMDSKELKEKGFVDSIIDEDAEISASIAAIIVSQTAPEPFKIAAQAVIKQKDTSKNDNKTDMDLKLIALKLGLKENATEAEVNAKLDDINALANETETFKAKYKKLEGEGKSNKVKTILDKAVTDKKITAENRTQFEAIAKNTDLVEFEAMIDAMHGVPTITAGLKGGGDDAVEGIDASRKDWTYEDWMAKDEEGLNKLREDNEKAFTALYNNHYNIK